MADLALSGEVGPTTSPRLTGLASRISVMYATIYLHYGAFGLYIPMWFAHRGLDPEQIGVLMSLPLLLRILFVAPVTGLADRLRRIREVLLVCVVGAMLMMSTMTFAHSYWQMLLFFTLFSLVWDPLPILADGYATLAVRTQQLDYGRMRLWGSLSFVVASTASGSLIGAYSAEIVPWLTAALLALPIIPILLLPPDRQLGASERAESKEWRKVIADNKLMLTMVATALVTASHTLLNTFGAIQWTAQGLSGSMIGLLIGLAIVSEIACLFLAQRLLGNRSPLWLIAIGGGVAVLRWAYMSTEPGLYELAVLALLNGITGMAVITGLMLFIAQRVDAHLISTAQGINAVVLGAIAAIATAASGYAWHALGSNSYLLAALVSAAGLVMTVVMLWKRR